MAITTLRISFALNIVIFIEASDCRTRGDCKEFIDETAFLQISVNPMSVHKVKFPTKVSDEDTIYVEKAPSETNRSWMTSSQATKDMEHKDFDSGMVSPTKLQFLVANVTANATNMVKEMRAHQLIAVNADKNLVMAQSAMVKAQNAVEKAEDAYHFAQIRRQEAEVLKDDYENLEAHLSKIMRTATAGDATFKKTALLENNLVVKTIISSVSEALATNKVEALVKKYAAYMSVPVALEGDEDPSQAERQAIKAVEEALDAMRSQLAAQAEITKDANLEEALSNVYKQLLKKQEEQYHKRQASINAQEHRIKTEKDKMAKEQKDFHTDEVNIKTEKDNIAELAKAELVPEIKDELLAERRPNLIKSIVDKVTPVIKDEIIKSVEHEVPALLSIMEASEKADREALVNAIENDASRLTAKKELYAKNFHDLSAEVNRSKLTLAEKNEVQSKARVGFSTAMNNDSAAHAGIVLAAAAGYNNTIRAMFDLKTGIAQHLHFKFFTAGPQESAAHSMMHPVWCALAVCMAAMLL